MSLQLTPLPADRVDEWRVAARDRIADGNRRSGLRIGADAVAHADRLLADHLPDGAVVPTAPVLLVVDDDKGEIGTIWTVLRDRSLLVLDVMMDVEAARIHGDRLLVRLRALAAELQAVKIGVPLFPQAAAARALVEGRGFALASIQMLREPLPDREVATGVVLSPMTAERYPRFAAESEAGFAGDLVASGRYTPEEAAAESHRQMVLELPHGRETEGQELFTASVDGVEVGILWLGMRERDGRPHAFILDIEVPADQRRRGYGRAMMLAAEREARRLGAHSIGLHVFGFNSGAIELYEGLGYRRVEETVLLEL